MTRLLQVLLVEDSQIAQLATKMQLIKQGCAVEVAPDGACAIQKTLAQHFDFILMDIGLGEGPDGFEVTQSIKNQKKGMNLNTPVFAVTAHSEAGYLEKAKTLGIVRYYNKPFTLTNIMEIMGLIASRP